MCIYIYSYITIIFKPKYQDTCPDKTPEVKAVLVNAGPVVTTDGLEKGGWLRLRSQCLLSFWGQGRSDRSLHGVLAGEGLAHADLARILCSQGPRHLHHTPMH